MGGIGHSLIACGGQVPLNRMDNELAAFIFFHTLQATMQIARGQTRVPEHQQRREIHLLPRQHRVVTDFDVRAVRRFTFFY
jgi:hypothetical protein